MDQAAREILRALRGQRSQQAFARRIGYRGNPSTHWEHGRRFPTAAETLRCAECLSIDVRGAFHRFNPSMELLATEQGYDLPHWMNQLRGKTSVTDIAKRLNRSRSTVSRWLSGSAAPRLPEFLDYLDSTTGRVADWVAQLVPIDHVPSLKEQYDVARMARRLAFEQPWTEALLRVLDTRQYDALPAHDSTWVGRVLGLDVERVDRGLRALEQAQIVRWSKGKYRQLKSLSVDTRGGKTALYGVKAHWSNVAAERALAPNRRDVFAYNVCSASRQDMERVREVLRRAYLELRSIVATSEPPEEVAIVNLQFIGWNPDELPT